MIFGKHVNRYYLKNAPILLLGIAALVLVDYFQLLVPELYRIVVNGVNTGQAVVDGSTVDFTMDVLLDEVCLPMIFIILAMVIGRFLWRVCFFFAQQSVWRPICAAGCLSTVRISPSNIIRKIRSVR